MNVLLLITKSKHNVVQGARECSWYYDDKIHMVPEPPYLGVEKAERSNTTFLELG